MFNVLSSPFVGIVGVIHIIAILYALITILGSNMEITNKILWILVVALFPVVGLLIYLLIGRK